MADAFIGEIRMFGGNYAPVNWALCNGQLIPISQNTALFSILGTMYGGNGTSTFALPNLQGRAPVMAGQGPGLTPRSVGETGGSSAVTLNSTQLPVHNHTIPSTTNAGTDQSPNQEMFGSAGRGRPPIYSSTLPTVQMLPTGPAGGNSPHNNLQPYLAVTFIICQFGIYPPRN
ncbi:MAG: phage tail protein [Acidobacteria bacterium]|nr:phage tail protein [Acidobacteriota bacterium]